MTTNSDEMDDDTSEQNEDDGGFGTCQLRDGETTDVSSHAQGNIEMIRQAERDGYMDEEDAEDAIENIKEKDKDRDEGEE